VREQYSGWKERQGQLERMWGSSEGIQKRGQEETSELEDEPKLLSKKRRTVSDQSLLNLLLKFGLGPSEYPFGPVQLSLLQCNLQLLPLQELGVQAE